MAVMKDVARLAGVSVATVSLVLGGTAKQYKVSDATIKRVNKAARELGYRINTRADGGKRRQRAIAVFFAMESTWTDLGAIAESIYRHMKARKVSYDILISSYEAGSLIGALEQTDWIAVDAAVVIAEHDVDLQALADNENHYPIVLLNRIIDEYDGVVCFAKGTIDQAVAMLQAKGHEDVAVISGLGKSKIGDEYFLQFLNACRHGGIAVNERHIIHADNTFQGGAVAARRLLNLERVPPMILCMNTTLAFGAIPVLARNKVYIPHNSELLCFGWDSELDYVKNYIPALSLVAIPMEEMTRITLELAMQVAQGTEREVAHYRCESTLALNESFTV